MKILHLFPDTNLFMQCRPLTELSWGDWADFDEVHLIITRPIQREIDKHKGAGSDRRAKRARSASRLIREILASPLREKVVRQAAPIVKLLLRADLKANPELKDRLNYENADDELVGIVHGFLQQEPDEKASILTHDTGPMATADMVKLAWHAIPDDWLLPPETSEADKKIKALQEEVKLLRSQEPLFEVACVNTDKKPVDKIEIDTVVFEPLTQSEVDGLLKRLAERFPVAIDFGSREVSKRDVKVLPFFPLQEIYAPANQKDIDEYTNKSYPAWLQNCGGIFRNYHTTKQEEVSPATCRFAIYNQGTRPGKDVLVTIEARGDLALMPLETAKKQTKNDAKKRELLPPPTAPLGKWTVELDGFSGLQDAMKSFGQWNPSRAAEIFLPAKASSKVLELGDVHDPNKVYWKKRPYEPSDCLQFQCQQWRHSDIIELFKGQLIFDLSKSEIEGVLSCRVEAANLSRPVERLIPVRITVRRHSVLGAASSLIDALVSSAEGNAETGV